MNRIDEESRQKGAMTILMAIAVVALVGIAAFAVDIGFGLVVRSELQNASDTGALAGNRELALIYKADGTWWGDKTLTATEIARVTAKVNEFTQKNTAGGKAITVATSDIVFGKYDYASQTIIATSPAYKGVKAIKVNARRDAGANGVVATSLARVLGINSYEVSANSGATLSTLSKMNAGGQGIPVGISKFWFTSKSSPCANHDKVNHGIRLYPTGSVGSCAGWHTFQDYPANAEKLRSVLDSLKTGTYVSPVTEANVTTFNFTGGTITNAFNNMKLLFDANKKMDSTGISTWKAIIPVYEASDCGNPSGAIKIVGFATAYIYSVDPGAKTIDATIDCNVTDEGEAGGANDYGTLVGRPGMVQ